MVEIQSRLVEIDLGGIPLKFATISLGANSDHWIFATKYDTGLLKNIIGGGFEAFYNKEEDDSFTFDPKFGHVDGWELIRGEYRYQTTTPDADRILRHIGVLAKEVINSQALLH